MFWHAILVSLVVSFTFILWNNFLLHSLFVCLIVSISAFQGSQEYIHMMTKEFIKKLEEEAKDLERQKDNEEIEMYQR